MRIKLGHLLLGLVQPRIIGIDQALKVILLHILLHFRVHLVIIRQQNLLLFLSGSGQVFALPVVVVPISEQQLQWGRIA
jgi:hypothetical protein